MENRKEKVKKSHKMDAFQIVLYVIVALYCLSMLYVLFFGGINSLKDATDYEWNNPFAFPSKEFGWHFENCQPLRGFPLGGFSCRTAV